MGAPVKHHLATLALLLLTLPIHAAVPGKTDISPLARKDLLSRDIEAALTALQLPLQNRVQVLRQQENALKTLKKIVNNADQPLTVRWRAMTSLGQVYPQKSLKFLIQQSKSKKWFHRNSSLLALKSASPNLAVRLSEKFLNDPALVVRTAAVQTLAELKAEGAREKLWKALDDKKNFRKGQSLWIRHHIMKTLAQFSEKQDQLRFVSYLHDKDLKVQLWAIDGLEKTTGLKREFHGMSFAHRKKKWIAWAAQNGQATGTFFEPVQEPFQ